VRTNRFRLFAFLFAGIFVFCAVVMGVVLVGPGSSTDVQAQTINTHGIPVTFTGSVAGSSPTATGTGSTAPYGPFNHTFGGPMTIITVSVGEGFRITSATASGTITAFASGSWFMGSGSSGPWTVGWPQSHNVHAEVRTSGNIVVSSVWTSASSSTSIAANGRSATITINLQVSTSFGTGGAPGFGSGSGSGTVSGINVAVAQDPPRAVTWNTGGGTWSNALPSGITGGGNGTSTARSSSENIGSTLADNRPGTLTRSGFNFNGWSPAGAVPEGSGAWARTAQWTAIPVTNVNASVTFRRTDTNATQNVSRTVPQNTNQSFSQPFPAQTPPANHTWGGWSPASVTVNVGNGGNRGTFDVSPVFNRINHTITWNTGGGTWANALPAGVSGGAINTATNRTSPEGQGLTPTDSRPGILTRPGWRFTGWSPSGVVSSAHTRTAQWVQQHTVTWNTGATDAVWVTAPPSGATGGAISTAANRTSVHDVNTIPVATIPGALGREGYSFDGWSPAVTAVSGARTHTAQWRRNFGNLPADPNPIPENWERGWNILRLHFGAGNAASTPLPGFDLNENGSTATRFYEPTSESSRQLPTVEQMNAWAANEQSLVNHRFLGWYTNPNWNVATGQRVTQIPAGLTGVLRYYARWTNQWLMDYISAGHAHSLGIRDGQLWAWGQNSFGRTGLGINSGNTLVPTRVGTASNWASVSAGIWHSLAVTTDGQLWAWGDNMFGEIGLNIEGGNSLVPTRVGTASNWASVSAGNRFSLAVTTNGQLWAWGHNHSGQTGLNLPGIHSVLTPTRVGTASNWASVSASCGAHSLAVTTDGQLWAWGLGNSGQTGLNIEGGGTVTLVPTRVGTATNWASVSAGSFHSLAVTADGQLWSWGANTNGETGLNIQGNTVVPTRVGVASNWASVSAGSWHSLAVTVDGQLWAWGSNDNGKTGLNIEGGNTLIPTRVGTASNWVSVSAGSWHSIAVITDDQIWAWGSNAFGRTGMSTVAGNTLVPHDIPIS